MNEHQTKLFQDADYSRQFLASYFSGRMGRHDFKDYILNRLAGDYACVFAAKIAELEEDAYNNSEALTHRASTAEIELERVAEELGLTQATAENCIEAIRALKSAPAPRLQSAANALIEDVKARHPGEELYCQLMIELDASVKETTRVRLQNKIDRDPVLKALDRCRECWEDGEGTDIGRDKLKALEAFGYIQMNGRQWEITDFGIKALSN